MADRVDAEFANRYAVRMHELLRLRGTLSRDDLEYLVEKAAGLRDERLKDCITQLIGWGDEERAEIETFVCVATEVMKRTNVSKLRQCAAMVELRYYSDKAAARSASTPRHQHTGVTP